MDDGRGPRRGEAHQAEGSGRRLLTFPKAFTSDDLAGIRRRMDRRQFSDEKTLRKVQRWDRRRLAVASQLHRIATVAK
jgi:hypothetical protein